MQLHTLRLTVLLVLQCFVASATLVPCNQSVYSGTLYPLNASTSALGYRATSIGPCCSGSFRLLIEVVDTSKPVSPETLYRLFHDDPTTTSTCTWETVQCVSNPNFPFVWPNNTFDSPEACGKTLIMTSGQTPYPMTFSRDTFAACTSTTEFTTVGGQQVHIEDGTFLPMTSLTNVAIRPTATGRPDLPYNQLEELTFHDYPLVDLMLPDAPKLRNFVVTSSVLQTIQLGSTSVLNKVTVMNAPLLSFGFGACPQMKEIVIHNTKLLGINKTELALMPLLETVNLGKGNISALEVGTFEHNVNLRNLDLQGNPGARSLYNPSQYSYAVTAGTSSTVFFQFLPCPAQPGQYCQPPIGCHLCMGGPYTCPAGSWCTGSLAAPQLCTELGTWCPEGSAAVRPCPAGSFCTTTSRRSECTPGTVCPERSVAPRLCTAGNVCPNTTVEILCPAGHVCGSAAHTPTPCPSGTYCPVGSLSAQPCLAGFSCPTPASRDVCTIGHFCPSGSVQPQPCPPGHVCNAPGLPQSTICPAGSVCTNASASPVSCPLGTYCASGALISTPLPCPPRHFCAAPSLAPSLCSPGFFCPGGTIIPQLCAPGVYCPTPQEALPCPSGHFCAQGSTTPAVCQQGQWCPVNSTTAQLCPVGYFCPSPQQRVRCPAGTFCPSGTTAAQTCQRGSVCSTPDIAAPCSPGSYCPPNSTSAAPCPRGSYCTTPSFATECPTEFFCPTQSTSPQPCTQCVGVEEEIQPCTRDQDRQCAALGSGTSQSVWDSVPWLDVGLLVGALLAALIMVKGLEHAYPDSKPDSVFSFLLAVVDAITDAFFLVDMAGTLPWALYTGLGIFVLSIVAHMWVIRRIFAPLLAAPDLREWMAKHNAWVAAVLLVGVTSPEAILVATCGLFGSQKLSAPIPEHAKDAVKASSGIKLAFETIPQLVLQAVVVATLGSMSNSVALALAVSVIQILLGVVSEAVRTVVSPVNKQEPVSREDSNSTSKNAGFGSSSVMSVELQRPDTQA